MSGETWCSRHRHVCPRYPFKEGLDVQLWGMSSVDSFHITSPSVSLSATESHHAQGSHPSPGSPHLMTEQGRGIKFWLSGPNRGHCDGQYLLQSSLMGWPRLCWNYTTVKLPSAQFHFLLSLFKGMMDDKYLYLQLNFTFASNEPNLWLLELEVECSDKENDKIGIWSWISDHSAYNENFIIDVGGA